MTVLAASPNRVDYPRILCGLLLVTIAYFLMMDPAFAATAGQGFSCSGGRAVGTLYDSSMNCPTTMGMNNVFTFLVCNMERLAGNLLGEMYCSIITSLVPAVLGVLTLATVFFGIGFTIGVIPATARDFQLFLLKMAIISVFATQADAMIGTGYALLVTGLREGTAIGISTMFPDDPAAMAGKVTGLDVYRYLDSFLGQAMRFATDYVGATWTPGQNPCKNAVFAVLAIMAVAFPPVFFIGILIIFRITITFLRAIFGYLYSIVGIVFLLTISPFFLSFYLFKQTRPFFDKWLGYLVSFALQMVILFSFLGFILSIDVKHISGSLTDIIMPVQENVTSTTMRMPWQYCTICEFKVLDAEGNTISPDDYAKDTIKEGRLACKDNPPKPIRALAAAAAPTEATGGTSDLEEVQSALIKFAVTGLLSLLVLAYVVEYLLNYVGMLAQVLAGGMGATYAPQLGGGESIPGRLVMDMPGGESINSFERGFTSEYAKNMNNTTFGSMAEGVKEGMKRMVLGGNRNEDGLTNDPGLVDSFSNFMLNPHRDQGQ
jgi:hypothetical protein